MGVQQLPIHANHCEMGMLFVRDYQWPLRLAPLLEQIPLKIYFDSGPLAIMAMSPALADFFSGQVKFLRLRRNRIDTAYSKMRFDAVWAVFPLRVSWRQGDERRIPATEAPSTSLSA